MRRLNSLLAIALLGGSAMTGAAMADDRRADPVELFLQSLLSRTQIAPGTGERVEFVRRYDDRRWTTRSNDDDDDDRGGSRGWNDDDDDRGSRSSNRTSNDDDDDDGGDDDDD